MGYGSFDKNDYVDRVDKVIKDKGTIHAYDADVKSGRASGIHKDLNPAGIKFRESCDSSTNPESRAIMIAYDVTGSMGEAPSLMQPKFPAIMGLVMATAGIKNPHILMMCVGDERYDNYPVQMGQFEIEAAKVSGMLENMIIEGGGGGNMSESYDLALYAAARKTKIDCFDKRGIKGYLFTIGDEKIYGSVSKEAVKAVFGDILEADIPIQDIINEVNEKYEYFHIIPVNHGTGNRSEVQQLWKKLLGERALLIENVEEIAELISGTIAACEGVSHSKIMNDMSGAGLATTKSISDAIVKISGSVTKVSGTASITNTSTPPKGLPTV